MVNGASVSARGAGPSRFCIATVHAGAQEGLPCRARLRAARSKRCCRTTRRPSRSTRSRGWRSDPPFTGGDDDAGIAGRLLHALRGRVFSPRRRGNRSTLEAPGAHHEPRGLPKEYLRPPVLSTAGKGSLERRSAFWRSASPCAEGTPADPITAGDENGSSRLGARLARQLDPEAD